MENHHQLTDAEFEKQFEDCTLNAEWFTHEAHLRLAWIHIRKYGVEQAIKNVCPQLIRYTESLGARDKFNKTVTVAALKAIDHFMKRSATDKFNDLILEFPRLKTDFKKLMAAHYGFDIFKSTQAKEEYLEPDLLPFS